MLIAEWRQKSSCTKWELLQLIGKLAHTTKVVVPGRTFLRRMIDTSTLVKHLDHYIKLCAGFHSDLVWWDRFLECLQSHASPHLVLMRQETGGAAYSGRVIDFSIRGSQHGSQKTYRVITYLMYVLPSMGPQPSAGKV